jgi:Predicted membrane protein
VSDIADVASARPAGADKAPAEHGDAAAVAADGEIGAAGEAARRRSVRAAATWLATRIWFWPTLLMFALGQHNLNQPELWRDELRTWSATTRSLPEMFHMLGVTDAAVALYYLFLHYWIALFGDSAVAMRMPSVLAMSAAAGLVTLVGKRLYNAKVGLIAGLLFAVIPSTTRFAQEARPYALTMLVAVGSTLLLLRAIEKRTWGRFVLYGLSIAVLALLQPVALPLLFVHAVGVLIWGWRDRALQVRAGAAALGGLVLAAPVLYISATQYGHQVGALPDPTLTELTKLPPRLFASGMLAGAIIVLALLAFAGPWRPAVFAGAWAVLPIGIVWLVSHSGSSYWMTRYMLPTLPGFVILAASVLAALRLPLLIAGVVIAFGLGVPDQRVVRNAGAHDQWLYPDLVPDHIQYGLAARTLEQHMRPGDGIVYSERWQVWLNDIGLAYHMRGKPMPRDVFLEQTAVEVGDFWVKECDDLAACLRNEERIWIVSVDIEGEDSPWDRLEPEKVAVLRDDYTVVERWEQGPLRGINLTLLVRNDLL